MLAYRLDVIEPAQIAATDPFPGAGLRIDTDGLALESAEAILTELFGTVPFVTFGSCAWLDTRAFPEGMSAEGALTIWRERMFPEERDGGDGGR
jgi:hypothetical protein